MYITHLTTFRNPPPDIIHGLPEFSSPVRNVLSVGVQDTHTVIVPIYTANFEASGIVSLTPSEEYNQFSVHLPLHAVRAGAGG